MKLSQFWFHFPQKYFHITQEENRAKRFFLQNASNSNFSKHWNHFFHNYPPPVCRFEAFPLYYITTLWNSLRDLSPLSYWTLNIRIKRQKFKEFQDSLSKFSLDFRYITYMHNIIIHKCLSSLRLHTATFASRIFSFHKVTVSFPMNPPVFSAKAAIIRNFNTSSRPPDNNIFTERNFLEEGKIPLSFSTPGGASFASGKFCRGPIVSRGIY